jgi:circadian clock protein KaiB
MENPLGKTSPPNKVVLRLYVAGRQPLRPLCALALDNLKRLCEKHLPGQYKIQVVDVLSKPQVIRRNQIVCLPTLTRVSPPSERKVIGSMTNEKRVLSVLGII